MALYLLLGLLGFVFALSLLFLAGALKCASIADGDDE
jgi:hypothetical protein